MPTHDYIIANGTGAAVRADINLALSAIVSLNSSASEPGTMYAYQLWADTAAGLLKIRNGANSAWITLRQLDGDFSIVAVEDGLQATPSLTFTNDLNTGIFRPGNDSLAIVTGATRAITITSTQAVGIQTANPSSALHVAGNARVGADDVTDAHLQIGKGATGNRNSYIDIVADTTYTDYGLRIIRNNTGANATSELKHRGTGALNFTTQEAAPIVFNTTNSPALTILAGGNVGIGSSSPASFEPGGNNLVVGSGSGDNGVSIYSGTANQGIIYFADGTTTAQKYTGFIAYDHNINAMRFGTNDGAERLRITSTGTLNLVGAGTAGSTQAVSFSGSAPVNSVVLDSSGRLLVGTSIALSVGEPGNALFQVLGRVGSATDVGRLAIARGEAATSITSGEEIGKIYFTDNAGNTFGQIECTADANAGASDFPGRLVFSTTPSGSASPTERMRIGQLGFIKASNTGAYANVNTAYHEINTNQTNLPSLSVYASSASFTAGVLDSSCGTSASTAFSLVRGYSGNGSDLEFNLRGDGNAFADGTWTGGGADYAEFFEWSDSNPAEQDRRGISVVLDGDKIREAVAGEDPIGVISGNPSVVGDAAWNKWNGKYLRDEFGTYIQEDYEVTDEDGNTVTQQRRKLNPAYDPNAEYIPREQRPEWDCVGLMGKLRIRKGQVTGARWIKMRDISDSVEEWLVR